MAPVNALLTVPPSDAAGVGDALLQYIKNIKGKEKLIQESF